VLERGSLVGLASQRDLHLIETLRDVDPAQVTVEEAMTVEPFQVPPDTPLAEMARHMALHRLGSAVVVDAQDRIVGLFTATDALAVLADMLDGS
jgi:acetoin utilization protein AcuB